MNTCPILISPSPLIGDSPHDQIYSILSRLSSVGKTDYFLNVRKRVDIMTYVNIRSLNQVLAVFLERYVN